MCLTVGLQLRYIMAAVAYVLLLVSGICVDKYM